MRTRLKRLLGSVKSTAPCFVCLCVRHSSVNDFYSRRCGEVLLPEIKADGYESPRPDKAPYGLLGKHPVTRACLRRKLRDRVADVERRSTRLVSLRSRVGQFEIQPLSPPQAQKLVRVVYGEEFARCSHLGPNSALAIAHCHVMCMNFPRVVVRLAHELMARFAKEERPDVELADLDAVGALGNTSAEFGRYFSDLIKRKRH